LKSVLPAFFLFFGELLLELLLLDSLW